ncbi:MAG: peptidylprolyl isomerase [Clostridia bacterium]|nr:peptidylprolyl isomerase [Clostridia bacterium]
MELELYPEKAPLSVANFKKLVSEGFYDGLTFHRIIEGFMIQGGDPAGNGTGGSPDTVKGEFSINGVNNDLPHEKGVVSMARSSYNNSGSSQFFICQGEKDRISYLDGQYAAFGKLTSGYDVLDRIAALPTDENDAPLTRVVITSVSFLND